MRINSSLTNLTLGTVAMIFVLTGCEKFALDRQMEDLCKKDGGVKVYETVTLPASMFDQLGDPFRGGAQKFCRASQRRDWDRNIATSWRRFISSRAIRLRGRADYVGLLNGYTERPTIRS